MALLLQKEHLPAETGAMSDKKDSEKEMKERWHQWKESMFRG
jgi:hypothetical protein